MIYTYTPGAFGHEVGQALTAVLLAVIVGATLSEALAGPRSRYRVPALAGVAVALVGVLWALLSP